MAALQFVETAKGKKKAILDGYMYTLEKVVADKSYWRCDNRSCNARLHSKNNVVVLQPTAHRLHAPSAASIASAVVTGEVRKKAGEGDTSTRNVVHQALAGVPVDAAASMPSTSSLSQIIRRKRRAAQMDDSDEADLPGPVPRRLQRTTDDGDFLRASSDDMIFLASDRGLQLLSEHEHWFADGTFYVAPRGFSQLYTIHVLLGETSTVPCIYVILKNKSTEAYVGMLQTLLDSRQDIALAPASITLDYEVAAINAFQLRFPRATIHGCFFHLSQSLWRKIQEVGLQRRYGEDASFALNARCLAAIAFLPTGDVVLGFETLTSGADFPDELDPVVDYFEATYIGNIGRGGRRRRPLFAHGLWSQNERVIDNLPRTTNSLEGWHNAFNGMVNKAHASVPSLIAKLQTEEASTSVAVERFVAGHPPQKKKKKYVGVDLRLRQLVLAYDPSRIVTFLRSIAHNLTL
jgi:hypothetical protein